MADPMEAKNANEGDLRTEEEEKGKGVQPDLQGPSAPSESAQSRMKDRLQLLDEPLEPEPVPEPTASDQPLDELLASEPAERALAAALANQTPESSPLPGSVTAAPPVVESSPKENPVERTVENEAEPTELTDAAAQSAEVKRAADDANAPKELDIPISEAPVSDAPLVSEPMEEADVPPTVPVYRRKMKKAAAGATEEKATGAEGKERPEVGEKATEGEKGVSVAVGEKASDGEEATGAEKGEALEVGGKASEGEKAAEAETGTLEVAEKPSEGGKGTGTEEGTPEVAGESSKGEEQVHSAGPNEAREKVGKVKEKGAGIGAGKSAGNGRTVAAKKSPGLSHRSKKRVLKKVAEEGGLSKKASGTFQKEEGRDLEKSESGKKRKSGFQKKDRTQEEQGLVRKEAFEIGDLVWTRLRGNPWWPSLVFDPEKASKKARKLQKPNHLLIAFYGDDTFAWHRAEDLVPFEANFETKSKQTGGGKMFQDAIEAAQEELERRKAAARGIVIEAPEEKAERLRVERTAAEKEAIAAYDPESILRYVRGLAIQPLDGPTDEPARIQALAYRSVVHHEEKEHPAKAGVLPGWRPIPKLEKRKPKPKGPVTENETDLVVQKPATKRPPKPKGPQTDSDEDVPILASPKTSKIPKTPKPLATPVGKEGDGSAPPKNRRGWPKGKPRGKKTPVAGDGETPGDGTEKKRRRKKINQTEGVSPSAKFDSLVAAIDDIESRGKSANEDEATAVNDTETDPGAGREKVPRKKKLKEKEDGVNGEVKEDGDGSAPTAEKKRVKTGVRIVTAKVKRATREEAGEELGALLDQLREIAHDPLENDPDSQSFRDISAKYITYQSYQIGRAKARYQRSSNLAAGIASRPPSAEKKKRKALPSSGGIPAEGAAEGENEEAGGKVKRRKEPPRKKKDEEDAEGGKVKVKRVRKRKEKVPTSEGENDKGKEKEGGNEADESSDEDVPLQKRMKIHADTALPPRKQVGTATPAQRIAEFRRRLVGAKGEGATSPRASEPGGSPRTVEGGTKASETSGKASAKGGDEPPAKPFEPLALFMRFPERFTVPSEGQLKANFVRFGELATYYGATRVLPHKSSAQIVFKRSEDADAAFKYCRKNTMFGNPRVRYELREVVLTGKKGHASNGGEPKGPTTTLTYDELLRGGPKQPGVAPPVYRPIQSQRPPAPGSNAPVAASGPVAAAKGPSKSILKDPRRPAQARPSLLLTSAMETLLNPSIPKQPPTPTLPLPAYTAPRPGSSNFPLPTSSVYSSQPAPYPPQPAQYSGRPPYATGQPGPYVAHPTSAAPAYGPRPPAYGPNQAQPPAYARPPQPPPGRPPFNHTPATYDPARPAYTAQFNHPPVQQPPLPPYPRGQPPVPPAYGQPPAAYPGVFGPRPPPRPAGGSFSGQILPPPPPPMPPAPTQQLATADVQKLADALQALRSQNPALTQNLQNPALTQSLQNPALAQALQSPALAQALQNPAPTQNPQTLPPPPPPMPERKAASEPGQGVNMPDQAGAGFSEPDAKEMHQERIGELIGEAAGTEDDSFRDMLEQLLTQAAELTQGADIATGATATGATA